MIHLILTEIEQIVKIIKNHSSDTLINQCFLNNKTPQYKTDF
jgi:hypothetical protein